MRVRSEALGEFDVPVSVLPGVWLPLGACERRRNNCFSSRCGELSVLITYVISCTYHFLYHCFHKYCVMCAFCQLLLLLLYDDLLLGALSNYKRATSHMVC